MHVAKRRPYDPHKVSLQYVYDFLTRIGFCNELIKTSTGPTRLEKSYGIIGLNTGLSNYIQNSPGTARAGTGV